jgi:peptide/nickel transport system substrate-binding protein
LGHRARDAGEPSQTGLNNDLAKEMAGQNNTSANRLRRNLFVSLLGILLLWLGACAAPARPPHLIATVTSDPKTFNTYLAAESSSRDAIAYLEAGLVTLDEDTLLPKPELAEGWEVSEDGLRYVFTLREGLRWSDGEPLTAADVDFTFNRIIFDERIPTSCAGREANWGSWSTASGAGPGRAAD